MGKTLSQIEADVQVLLKQIMPIAQAALEKQMGFAPLGACVGIDGSPRLVEAGEPTAAEARARVASLREQVRQQVQAGSVRAAAVAADILMWRSSDGDEASNAVSVHVEHQDGYCLDLLIPYKVKKGLRSRFTSRTQILFRKMIAQQSAAVFWPSTVAREG